MESPAKFIFRPSTKLFSAWHGPPVSSESVLHLSSLGLGVSAPSKLVGWTKDSGQTMHRGRAERAREGGLENYLRENTKAPNVGRTDDGAELNIPLEIQACF